MQCFCYHNMYLFSFDASNFTWVVVELDYKMLQERATIWNLFTQHNIPFIVLKPSTKDQNHPNRDQQRNNYIILFWSKPLH